MGIEGTNIQVKDQEGHTFILTDLSLFRLRLRSTFRYSDAIDKRMILSSLKKKTIGAIIPISGLIRARVPGSSQWIVLPSLFHVVGCRGM